MKLFRCSMAAGMATLLAFAVVPAWKSAGAPPAAGSVVPTGSMILPRSGHTATRLPNGRVLIAGGMVRNGEFLADSEIYDPATGKFTAADKMSTRRVSHTATLLPNGKVLIVGGLEGRYQAGGRWMGRTLASAEIFDPATNTFTPTGRMSEARNAHGAVLLADGKVLIVGGAGDGDWRMPRATAELYDPATGTFSPAGTMSTPRIPHAVVLLKNGDALVAGGTGPNRTVLASAELYHPATRKFTPGGHLLVPRHKHAAVLLADGRVLITGGSDERDWNGQTATAELYDPARGVFVETGKMTTARFKLGHAVVRLADGRVLLAGGGVHAEVYDPATESFREAAGNLDAPWHFSTATLLADGKVLIAGGYGNSPEATARAWVYQP